MPWGLTWDRVAIVEQGDWRTQGPFLVVPSAKHPGDGLFLVLIWKIKGNHCLSTLMSITLE